MSIFAFILGAFSGSVLMWAVAYWCTRRRTAVARFVRQTLNLGGPGGDQPPPP